jgi:hypothetical protein
VETTTGNRAQQAQTSPSLKFEELKSATVDAGRSATLRVSALATAAAASLLCWALKTPNMRCDSVVLDSRRRLKAKQAEKLRRLAFRQL